MWAFIRIWTFYSNKKYIPTWIRKLLSIKIKTNCTRKLKNASSFILNHRQTITIITSRPSKWRNHIVFKYFPLLPSYSFVSASFNSNFITPAIIFVHLLACSRLPAHSTCIPTTYIPSQSSSTRTHSSTMHNSNTTKQSERAMQSQTTPHHAQVQCGSWANQNCTCVRDSKERTNNIRTQWNEYEKRNLKKKFNQKSGRWSFISIIELIFHQDTKQNIN